MRARPWRARGLAGDTIISLVAIGIVGCSSVAFNLAIGRWLGPRALGLAGLGLGVGMGVAQVAVSGIGPATTRFSAAAIAAGRTESARRAVGRGLAAAICIGALGALIAKAGAVWWATRIGMPRAMIDTTAILILAQSTYFGLKASLYGLGEVPRYAAIEAVAGLAFALALAAVVLVPGVPLLTPFLIANVAFTVLALPAVAEAARGGGTSTDAALVAPTARQAGAPTRLADATKTAHPAGRRGTSWAGGMAVYALIATVGSSAALARLSLAPLVTGNRWPAAEVGLLQAALSFLLVVMFIPRALELALFPALSAAHGRADAGALRRGAREATEASALVLGVVAGAAILVGRPLMVGLFGPEFASAAGALTWVVISGWALGLAVPSVAALSGAEAVWVPNAAALLGLLTSALVWAHRVPASGSEGAAIGLAAGSLVNAVIPLAAARRMLGVRMRRTARLVGTSVALLVATAVAAGRLGVPDAVAAGCYVGMLVLAQRRWFGKLLRRARATET